MVEFRVGDKVYSTVWGWGEVKRINTGVSYPVVAEFGDNKITYTEDGRQCVGSLRSLFFEEIPIPESALVRKYQYKKGELVWYKTIGEADKIRFFSHYGIDGIVYLFANGKKVGATFDVREDKIEPYVNQ